MLATSKSYLLCLPSFLFTCSVALFARMAYMLMWLLIKYRITKLLVTQLLLSCS